MLTGIIRAEDKDHITLVTANETITLPKSEVEERRTSEQSMMPEDLWKPLSEHEIRSLVSYLASPAQVPLPDAAAGRKPRRPERSNAVASRAESRRDGLRCR